MQSMVRWNLKWLNGFQGNRLPLVRRQYHGNALGRVQLSSLWEEYDPLSMSCQQKRAQKISGEELKRDRIVGQASSARSVFQSSNDCIAISGRGRALKASGLRASLDCEWRSMFDFNLMKITAEQIQSGRTLSEALDVAEARRIYLSEEWTPLSCPP